MSQTPLYFPPGASTGTQVTGSNGVTYIFDGQKWVGHSSALPAGSNAISNNGNVLQVQGDGSVTLPTGAVIQDDGQGMFFTPNSTFPGYTLEIAAYGEIITPNDLHIFPTDPDLGVTVGDSSQGSYIQVNGHFNDDTVMIHTWNTARNSSWVFGVDGTTEFPDYTFPAEHGSVGQILVDDGSGNLVWTDQNVAAGFGSLIQDLAWTTPESLSTNIVTVTPRQGGATNITGSGNNGGAQLFWSQNVSDISASALQDGLGASFNWAFLNRDGFTIENFPNGNTDTSYSWRFAPDGSLKFPEDGSTGASIMPVEGGIGFGTDSGNVVIWPGNSAYIFGQDGNLILPGNVLLTDRGRINSGGVGVTNSAEFGTDLARDGDDNIVSSQIYMGAGTGEFRNIALPGDPLYNFWFSVYGDLVLDSSQAFGGSVVHDSEGNLLVFGQEVKNYKPDNIALKYAPTGELLYSKSWVNPQNSFNSCGSANVDVVIDSQDNIYWLSIDSNSNPYDVSYVGTVNTDLVINDLATKLTNFDASDLVAVEGQIYVAGLASPQTQPAILQVDPSGNSVVNGTMLSFKNPNYWYSVYGDIGSQHHLSFGQSVAHDSQGNVYVFGQELTGNFGNSADTVALKYSPTGELLYRKSWVDPQGNPCGTSNTDFFIDDSDNIYWMSTELFTDFGHMQDRGQAVYVGTMTSELVIESNAVKLTNIIAADMVVAQGIVYISGVSTTTNTPLVIAVDPASHSQFASPRMLVTGTDFTIGEFVSITYASSGSIYAVGDIVVNGYHQPIMSVFDPVTLELTQTLNLYDKDIGVYDARGVGVQYNPYDNHIYTIVRVNGGSIVSKFSNFELVCQWNTEIDLNDIYDLEFDADYVYITGNYNYSGFQGIYLACLDAGTGNLLWQNSFGTVYGPNTSLDTNPWQINAIKSLSVFEDRITVVGTTGVIPESEISQPDLFTLQVPKDGSLTGNYGSFDYINDPAVGWTVETFTYTTVSLDSSVDADIVVSENEFIPSTIVTHIGNYPYTYTLGQEYTGSIISVTADNTGTIYATGYVNTGTNNDIPVFYKFSSDLSEVQAKTVDHIPTEDIAEGMTLRYNSYDGSLYSSIVAYYTGTVISLISKHSLDLTSPWALTIDKPGLLINDIAFDAEYVYIAGVTEGKLYVARIAGAIVGEIDWQNTFELDGVNVNVRSVRAISVFENRLAISVSIDVDPLTYNNNDTFVTIQIPTDGSLTGYYGPAFYSPVDYLYEAGAVLITRDLPVYNMATDSIEAEPAAFVPDTLLNNPYYQPLTTTMGPGPAHGSKALIYAGVENPGFAGLIASDGNVSTDYSIYVDVNGFINIGGTSVGYTAALGVSTAESGINGVAVNMTETVIVGGEMEPSNMVLDDTGVAVKTLSGANVWKFTDDAALVIPGQIRNQQGVALAFIDQVPLDVSQLTDTGKLLTPTYTDINVDGGAALSFYASSLLLADGGYSSSRFGRGSQGIDGGGAGGTHNVLVNGGGA